MKTPKYRLTYFPGDTHFKKHAIGSYGYDAWCAAMVHVKDKRMFVDVGAHIGHFTYNAMGKFKRIIAIEPVRTNFVCLQNNAARRDSALRRKSDLLMIHGAAADVNMRQAQTWWKDPSGGDNSGAWEMSLEDNGGAMIPLDVFTVDGLELPDCDLIKIDTQGWESRILDGARETIERCKPVMIVEVVLQTNPNIELIDKVCGMGYNMVGIMQKNAIFKHK